MIYWNGNRVSHLTTAPSTIDSSRSRTKSELHKLAVETGSDSGDRSTKRAAHGAPSRCLDHKITEKHNRIYLNTTRAPRAPQRD